MTGLTTEHLALADIGSSEGYTDWHGLGFPSFAAATIRAGVLDGPHEVLVSRSVHTWDFTVRSEAQLRFEAFSVAAHGATATVDDQPNAAGAADAQVYARLAGVFTRIGERAPWLDGRLPYRFAALWAGEGQRDLESLLGNPESASSGEQSAQFPPSERRLGPTDLVAAVTGSFRALVESHLPVELVDERTDMLSRLTDFTVVVLPDVPGGGSLRRVGTGGVRARRWRPGDDRIGGDPRPSRPSTPPIVARRPAGGRRPGRRWPGLPVPAADRPGPDRSAGKTVRSPTTATFRGWSPWHRT